MADSTSIEWTSDPITGRPGATWNLISGCSVADPSCINCYAMRLTATRLRKQPKYEGLATMGANGPRWTGEVRLHPELLPVPLGWRRRRRIFVCSMSDLFHKDVPDHFIAEAWAWMLVSYMSRGHLHLVLTKRASRASRLLSSNHNRRLVRSALTRIVQRGDINRDARVAIGKLLSSPIPWPAPGVHLGVSAGAQDQLIERWGWLSKTPVQARFLSLEPLIAPIDLGAALARTRWEALDAFLDGGQWADTHTVSSGPMPYRLPDQVIVGGESAPRDRARLMHPDWVRSIRDSCERFRIPFFFKQWGNYNPSCGCYTSKKAAGRELDGRTHDELPRVCSSCYEPGPCIGDGVCLGCRKEQGCPG